MKDVLVIGGDSKLGWAMQADNHDFCLTLTTRRMGAEKSPQWIRYDLLDPQFPVSREELVRFEHVFILAAITKVVECEGSAEAWRINADAPAEIARRACDVGVHPLFVSSDAVERAPNLAYSTMKAYAELAVLSFGGYVLRPARITDYDAVANKLYSAAHGFVRGLERYP